jgi:hypothetical protein
MKIQCEEVFPLDSKFVSARTSNTYGTDVFFAALLF